jgi:hypothetical protein
MNLITIMKRMQKENEEGGGRKIEERKKETEKNLEK